MSEIQLVLTAEECESLVNLLESTLKNTRVEEHRTRSPSYRDHILQEEKLFTGLLSKLRQARG